MAHVPALSAVKPVVFPNLPGGQAAQPAGSQQPSGHAEPFGQGRQAMGSVIPSFDVKVPAGHGKGNHEASVQ